MTYPDFSSLDTMLNVKDFTVSKENFQLKYWPEYEMLVTYPQPDKDNLASYYDSEDYISHTDKKASFVDNMYHLVKGVMLKRKLRLIDKYQAKKGTLLDIGAGTGDFCKAAAKRGWEVTAFEPNQNARRLAQKKGVVMQSNLSQLPKNHFDVITLWHVLEHVPNLYEYIKLLKSLLKDSGTLVIAVPNYRAKDAIYYKEFWAAYDVPRHLWHFSSSGLSKLFSKFHFGLKGKHPMVFDAYYVSLLSEQYRKSSFKFIRAILIGLWSNVHAIPSKQYSSLIYTFEKAD